MNNSGSVSEDRYGVDDAGYYSTDDEADGSHERIAADISAPSSPDIESAIDANANFLATGIKNGERTVKIKKLHERRKNEGYQREDGRTELYGKEGTNDRFGHAYLEEQELRRKLLDDNPDYQFATLVQGNLNMPIQEIVDTSDIEAALRAQLAKAREEARRRRQSSATIETLRRAIAESEDKLKDMRAALSSEKRILQEWTNAIKTYRNKLEQAETELELGEADAFKGPSEFLTTRGLRGDQGATPEKVANAFFDLATRVAVMRYGANGVQSSGFSRDMQSWFGAYFTEFLTRNKDNDKVDKDTANEIADNLGPQGPTLALYLALLRSVTRPGGNLVEYVERMKAEGRLQPESLYYKSPQELVADYIALANILMPDKGETQSGADNLLLYKNVSLVLVKHINKMLRSALSSAESISDPKVQAGGETGQNDGAGEARPVTRQQKKVIGGAEVVIDIPDIDLEQMARGDDKDYTEEELTRARRQLYVNIDRDATRMALIQILSPLFNVSYPSLFYVNPGVNSLSVEDYEALLAEGGSPTETRFGALVQIFDLSLDPIGTLGSNTHASLFLFARRLLDQAIFSDTEKQRYTKMQSLPKISEEAYQAMIASFFRVSLRFNTQWEAYTRYLRERLFRRLLLRPLAAVVLIGSRNVKDGNGDDTLNIEEEETLRKFVFPEKRPEKEENIFLEQHVFAILENGIGSGENNTGLDLEDNSDKISMIETSSNRIANFYATQQTARKIDAVLLQKVASVANQKSQLKSSLQKLREKLEEALLQTPEEEAEEIRRNFESAYEASRGWAMRPENSGVLRFRAKFMTGLSNAYIKVRRYCPNLRNVSHERIQRHAATRADYARLVAIEILMTEINNPSSYKRDKAYDELSVQQMSAMNNLKDAILDAGYGSYGSQGGVSGIAFRRADFTGGYFM